jgi:Flp pilus assembly protein CpaB
MVLTAARDLPAGVVLQRADLTSTAFAPDSVPSGALAARSVVGRTTTSAIRSGEPITGPRLVAGSLLDGFAGLVAVPVRIGDPGAVRLLRVGDHVDLLAADPQGDRPAEVLGRDVPVLAIPRDREESPGLTNGALVVVGLPNDSVRTVAQASVSSFLSVILTG